MTARSSVLLASEHVERDTALGRATGAIVDQLGAMDFAVIASRTADDDGGAPRARHATITNSTYDGICYDARRLVQLLAPSVDRLHFDEAWYGYARFHPLYEGRYGMYGDAAVLSFIAGTFAYAINPDLAKCG